MWKTLFPVVVLYNYAGPGAEVWVTGNCPMWSEYKHSYCWKRAGCFSRAWVCHSETLLLRLQGWGGGNCRYFPPCIAGLSLQKHQAGHFSLCFLLSPRWLPSPWAAGWMPRQTLPAHQQHSVSPPVGPRLPGASHTTVCSAASALPKIFQLRKAETSNISSGNETHCWMKTPFVLPIPCIVIFKLLNGFSFFPIYYSSFTPLCLVLGWCTVTLHNHRQPPASGRLTVTQMCHMKGEVGLMTVGNAFAYFLKKKKTKNLPSFILIVELRVIPAQRPELLNEEDSCYSFTLLSAKIWVIRKKAENYSICNTEALTPTPVPVTETWSK